MIDKMAALIVVKQLYLFSVLIPKRNRKTERGNSFDVRSRSINIVEIVQ